MSKYNNYCYIPSSIMKSKKLNGKAKLLYSELINFYCNFDGICIFNFNDIEIFNVKEKERSIEKGLNNLEVKGFIKITNRVNRNIRLIIKNKEVIEDIKNFHLKE